MTTINKSLAQELARNGGRYETDPRAYCVFEYRHCDYGHTCYAVVYDPARFLSYATEHAVTAVLWPKEQEASLLLAAEGARERADTIYLPVYGGRR